MQAEPESVRRLVESLTGEALKQFLNNLRHHVEVQRRVAQGQLRQNQVNAAYVKYALREGSGYRDEVGMLTARYYRDLLDVGARYSERFYNQMLEAPPSSSAARDGDGAPERASLELHGPPGHEVVDGSRWRTRTRTMRRSHSSSANATVPTACRSPGAAGGASRPRSRSPRAGARRSRSGSRCCPASSSPATFTR